jgi:hypothetical protein
MAAFTGYFDDSKTEGQILTIAGYVAAEEQWEKFEKHWAIILASNGVPYFHMKEFGRPNGPYRKWLPAKRHYKEIANFLNGLAWVIGSSKLSGFAATVRIKDLQRFNLENSLRIDAYALAAYSCMVEIGRARQGSVISLFFDHLEQAHSKLELADKYASGNDQTARLTELVQPIPLNKKLGYAKVRAIQAADFAAWEIRKHSLKISDWFDIEDRPWSPWGAVFDHYFQWTSERFGNRLHRKSFDALLENAPIANVVWDYRQLCQVHEARRGVWAA